MCRPQNRAPRAHVAIDATHGNREIGRRNTDLGTRNAELGTRNSERTWNQEPGTRNYEPDTGNATLEEAGRDLDLVVRLDFVVELHRDLDGPAAHEAHHLDAAIASPFGETASDDDRLRDRGAGIKHERSGALHEARNIEALVDRDVD